ncbi:hypothetical protein J8F10_07215 [Gemmata sp. G18]|uniref:Uncharacterized protein n=1 Tax=Gemmata palustris TaxID=2822762 RepID=A0ABS5BMV6_9BACT|nr:hypothetical protein [Gemmata palustris]MBP3955068.1 hypothetical protein [Gemmata palustris]
MSEPALLDPPTTTGPAPAVSLADLILLRLLPTKASIQLKQLHTDLGVFFRRPMSAEHLEDALTELRADGFVAPKGQRATDAGRARALEYLGIEKLPPRANWTTVQAKYLVPRALGPSLDSEEYEKAKTGENLAAFLLKRQLRLPASTGHTLTKIVDALLCRALGHPDFTALKTLIQAKLGEAIGGDPISQADAKKVLPRVRLNVSQLDKKKLYAAILDGRLDEPRTSRHIEPVIDEPFDLEMFANTVKSVARTCPTGRFGDNKVFISHVWKQLCDEPRFAALGFDGFKAKLIEANRADLLTLSRADLVQLMDPADVRASETTYLTATFHFILVEGN